MSEPGILSIIIFTFCYSYLLAICTFTPLYGRLCNVLGRRGANQTAVIFAALGTLVCGLSNSMEMLIAARFVRMIGYTIVKVENEFHRLEALGVAEYLRLQRELGYQLIALIIIVNSGVWLL